MRMGRNELSSTVEAECLRQIEIYLSNSKTRIKRQKERARRKLNGSQLSDSALDNTVDLENDNNELDQTPDPVEHVVL